MIRFLLFLAFKGNFRNAFKSESQVRKSTTIRKRHQKPAEWNEFEVKQAAALAAAHRRMFQKWRTIERLMND